ncbi:MAG: (Fe-S)-binding protein [Planctomycetes bacterium]|nr:(Fe-S)-binding protein [Planctomycetota bacterium]
MDLATTRTYCTYCPKLCRHVCPVAESERTEAATPTFKQQVALLASTGERPLDAERAEVLYKCTDCRATVPACRHRIDVGASLHAAKVEAVRQGVAPPAAGRVAERFAATGSPYDLDLRARVAAAVPGGLSTCGAVGVWPSCATAAHRPEALDRVVAALRRAGVDAHAAMPDPPCCGDPLDALGHQDAFRLHAARVVASLAGFETVAVEGPACAHALLARYRSVGVRVPFEVVPLVDLLARRLPAAGQRSSARHAYHDPCNLGRKLGRYDAPRAVVRALTGAEPVELAPSREASLCAGGGGGYPVTNPEGASGCAARVLEAFRASGADVLVSGCPSAARLMAKTDPTARVTDLTGLVVGEGGGVPAGA